ncbi:Fpg/Nei family DNA glycosylase [soil metagenome]
MPELPELQAHAERLDAAYAGAPLDRFSALTFHALKTFSPRPEVTTGQALVFVGRRGKYLLADFGTATFVVHLMQGGRLRPEAPLRSRKAEQPEGGTRIGEAGAAKAAGSSRAQKPRGGLARWEFGDDRAWLLTEAGHERRAGVWVVGGDPESSEPLSKLGPDANLVDATTLVELFAAHPMRLHGFLRDQRIIAGIGRRLANEVCHRAKLSPFATTRKLGTDEAERLVEAIAVTVNESLAFERGRDDMSSSADRPGAVHHREGEACPVCADTVRSVSYRSYTVGYCPTCQTSGKFLADNTTSKFLK